MIRKPRSGFTLVEMLVVLTIVAILAVILIPISLRRLDRSQVSEAASMVQGGLAQAKTRAQLERRPHGLRITVIDAPRRLTATGVPMAWYGQMWHIEQPEDFTLGWVWSAVPGATAGGAPPANFLPPLPPAAPSEFGAASPAASVALPTYNPAPRPIIIPTDVPNTHATIVARIPEVEMQRRWLFGPYGTAWAGVLPGQMSASAQVAQRPGFTFVGFVEPGDRVEVDGIGQIFTVVAVYPPSPAAGGFDPMPSCLLLDRPLPRNVPPPMNGRSNYRVIRQPRILANTPPLKLPSDVVIDLNPPTTGYGSLLTVQDRSTDGRIWMRGVSVGVPVASAGPGVPNPPIFFDLMFNPAGQLMPTASVPVPDGFVHLWVHPWSSPDAWHNRSPTSAAGHPDNQALVSIAARIGAISSFPVFNEFNPASPPLGPNGPWYLAEDGRARGVGGL